MAEDEESQIAEDFGRMVRIITGSAMQVHENRARRAQMSRGADAAQAEAVMRMENNAAQVLHRDMFNAQFWKHAGPESIADHMSVAASMSDRNPVARSAWMHGADMIRSIYGLDVQAINREYPNTLVERHNALRDALDDLVQKNTLDAESDVLRAEAQRTGDGLPAERAEAEADRENQESAEARERADRVREAHAGEDVEADTEGLAARRDFARERAESEHERAGLEAALKGNDARADLVRVRAGDSAELAEVRERQLVAFTKGPQAALAAAGKNAWGRRGAKGQQGQETAREAAMSR